MRTWTDDCLHWLGLQNEQASAACMRQRCARLELNQTRRSAGRLAGRGLAGRAAIAAEFSVAADAAAMTPGEPKSRSSLLINLLFTASSCVTDTLTLLIKVPVTVTFYRGHH